MAIAYSLFSLLGMDQLDKDKAIQIICDAFADNPSVIRTVKPGKNIKKRIRNLASYAYKTSKMRDGIFFSSNHESIALCYKYNFKKEGIRDLINQVLLVFNAIGLNRVMNVLKRDAYVKRQRPSDGNYLYFWFFGATNASRGGQGAWELKNQIFRKSEELGLPIYLETSIPQNKVVYERFGFETYHMWRESQEDKPLYFMRRQNAT